ncbi:hypothetical protein ISN45_Aa04g027250 [Arabidopsis thaliana x Arabidopsis arenosa]|uniref:Uncharacterized protein n=1 Tax=Arabidopsis thaliana x Arabidopsis arenosa TaxID=1240361 RepID=A0A8T2ABH8_9BRAS|nr:hypothetical protein ISN45_Aa04g027250 [Arabidopsis thaliana x Arabidopsis arenosa]
MFPKAESLVGNKVISLEEVSRGVSEIVRSTTLAPKASGEVIKTDGRSSKMEGSQPVGLDQEARPNGSPIQSFNKSK